MPAFAGHTPCKELNDAILATKQRNPSWGCPRIAQQIALAFGLPVDKDVVRRVLAAHYQPKPDAGGPVLADFPRSQQRQSLEHGPHSLRVSSVADSLGPGGHGSIHASHHGVR